MIQLIHSWCWCAAASVKEKDRERLPRHAERTSGEVWWEARWLRTCDRVSAVGGGEMNDWGVNPNGGIHLHQALSLKYVISSSPALCSTICFQPLSPMFKWICIYNEISVPIHLVVKQNLLHLVIQLGKTAVWLLQVISTKAKQFIIHFFMSSCKTAWPFCFM